MRNFNVQQRGFLVPCPLVVRQWRGLTKKARAPHFRSPHRKQRNDMNNFEYHYQKLLSYFSTNELDRKDDPLYRWFFEQGVAFALQEHSVTKSALTHDLSKPTIQLPIN